MITATIQLKSEKIFFLFFFYKYSFFTGHTKEMLCPLMESWTGFLLTSIETINMNSTHNTDILATFDSQMLILFLLFYLLKSTAEAGRTPVSDLSTFSFVRRYFLTVCTSIGNCGLWYLSRAATILDLYSFSLLHITTNLYLIPKMER